MHAIHTTPGLVIDSRPHGEAGKVISIFTRDLGLLTATAAGIRLEKSKLRYHVQDNSFGTFSLVRGKEFWRLTSAQDATDPLMHPVCDSAESRMPRTKSQELIARISLLLRRLLHGEEPHPELFTCIESCARFLNENQIISEEQAKTLESLIVLRILHLLGYVGKDSVLDGAAQSGEISLQLLDSLTPKRSAINQHINKALRESHL